MTPNDFLGIKLTGRNRRLLNEWKEIDKRLRDRKDIFYEVRHRNELGLPTAYTIEYHLNSICGVSNLELLGEKGMVNTPIFAQKFILWIDIPRLFPNVDASPNYYFKTVDINGCAIPHPWHPNIRYFGMFAGRVCLNQVDTYAEIIRTIHRIAAYLRYERYHAKNIPPFPEDLKVAQWVLEQVEPNGWIYFKQNDNNHYQYYGHS